MAGLGLFSVGSTPFGDGTPVAALVPPSDSPELANFVSPRTGDYVVADDGALQRMPIVRQQVLMLLQTLRDSATVLPGIGLALPAKMDQTFEQKARGAVLLALEPIGNDIRIDAIPVKRTSTGRADITVEYTDLTTGNSDTVTI